MAFQTPGVFSDSPGIQLLSQVVAAMENVLPVVVVNLS